MNVNFGLFPADRGAHHAAREGPAQTKAFARKRALRERALADLERWLVQPASVAAE